METIEIDVLSTSDAMVYFIYNGRRYKIHASYVDYVEGKAYIEMEMFRDYAVRL